MIARAFLPGESTPGGGSRTERVLRRVLAAPRDSIAAEARLIRQRYGPRHHDLPGILRAHANAVRALDARQLSADEAIVVGAAFTAEFAVEGAALCNPSAVRHPDQSGLGAGQLRVLMSLRSIGEPHFSSIQFCEAIVGPGRSWEFLPRAAPLRTAEIDEGSWSREHLLAALRLQGHQDDLTRAIGQELPDRFGSRAVEAAVGRLRLPRLHEPDARARLDVIRVIADSAYGRRFADDSPLSSRLLLPAADEERHGIEDLRLVADQPGGRPGFRGTYTAYDGQAIASRLLSTTDFRSFTVERLIGPPAVTKGMALFPRPVGGRNLALTRTDGETIGLAESRDGLDWGDERPLHGPSELWDVVQGGNCGSPIETQDGWLVLTHGVGPMRAYGIGAILLDLDHPERVIATLPGPLIDSCAPGYVPNVAYSCGGIVHEGILWVPHGVADDRIRVASVSLGGLLTALRPR